MLRVFGWGVCLVVALSAKAATVPAPASPPSASKFFAEPIIAGAQLSPDGHHIAVIRRQGDNSMIAVENLDSGTPAGILGSSDKNQSFDWVRWKSNSRLIVGATYLEITRLNPKDPDSEIVDLKYGKYMLAVDSDGKNQVILIRGDKKTANKASHFMDLLDVLKGDRDHILAEGPTASGQDAIWLTDVRTGAAQVVEQGDDDTIGWDTDRTGAVVIRYRQLGKSLQIEGRAQGEAKWTQIIRIKKKEAQKELADFEILGDGETPGTVYVAVKPANPSVGVGRNIHIYDFRTRTLGPALWPALPFDISGIVQSDATNSLKGVCYWVDVLRCDYKDPSVEANTRAIEKFFHNERSVQPVSWSQDGKWSVLQVSGPTEPGSYYLYDWTKHQLSNLGLQYPDLTESNLGEMTRVPFKARDGIEIPAYLTRPPNAPKGPLPLVVMPHGGPMMRDDYDFDPWSQFIATRGYLVLQLNFRGSGGYGVNWLNAGFRQWGGLMQDDIVDGVRALIAQGLVDPKRICIFGASYGGYAALIQGGLHPELYKCVVSWAGVSDLEKLLKDDRSSDGKDSEVYNYELKELGDPDADHVALAKASPITYADNYASPVLLVHGLDDTTVKVDQSKEMAKALQHGKRDVRLVLVKGENHRDWDKDNMVSTMDAVAAFIDAHIGPAVK
ncbi:MAG TPA: S9 family peptidase [Caulobacteraceae bacterium]|jgi:dipeptidyl aminopeptidase/acylaminoacyl peptidase